MKLRSVKLTKEYETPSLQEHRMFMEGVLCLSGGDNESYGGDPTEEDSIF